MTRNKTPPHIKLDERNHAENPLHSHLDLPDWNITVLVQDLLTGKVHVAPLLEDGTP
jgi:hypothetical protein